MSKKDSSKMFEVKSPCGEDWNKMRGGERVRFCEHCDLNVNNISALTRKEALRLVRESNGRLCVRYVKNPKTNAPVFADRLYKITRRASLAAGVLGASLTLSTLAYAQGDIAVNLTAETQKTSLKKSEKDLPEGGAGSISGVITDANGAVIPGVIVTLTGKDAAVIKTTASSDAGAYEFKNVSAGTYSLKAVGVNGFKTFVAENISLAEGDISKRDIQLEPDVRFEVMGGLGLIEFFMPLHRAVSDGDVEQVKELIARGENVNAKDENYSNITPLFLAVENGGTEIVQTLLSFGAKANARDENRQTPLMRLDGDANAELVRILIKHGAKVKLLDNENNSVLIWAVENGAKTEVLQTLLRHGANIDAQNKAGETALMKAAGADNQEAVRVLLEAGADVSLKNKAGETAWDLASDGEIEKLLESYGADAQEN